MTLAATRKCARIDLKNLPKTSVARLYEPATRSNSIALDGFPKTVSGKSWQERLLEIIEQWGALDMTTNQTLLRQLVETTSWGQSPGSDPKLLYDRLYTESAREAAEIFGDIHEKWPAEGRVSQEASALITDRDNLIAAAKEIWLGSDPGNKWDQGVKDALLTPNQGSDPLLLRFFVKIPNIPAGPEAVRECTRAGISVNATLVFSIRHYLDMAEAYVKGLSDRVNDDGVMPRNMGLERECCSDPRKLLNNIFSVNSLFVSRLDRVVDPMIDPALSKCLGSGPKAPKGPDPIRGLKGKTAVAHAKIVYRIFEAVFLGKSFQDPENLLSAEEKKRISELGVEFGRLKKFGANPQRLLLASTGVKSDQPYHPLLYVLPFLGPWVHNTVPEETLKAFSDFVAALDDDDICKLKSRSVISEGLPEAEQTAENRGEWIAEVLTADESRKLSPDKILRQVTDLILLPAGKTLEGICGELCDKGAKAFEADERATLELIEKRMQNTGSDPKGIPGV